MVEIERYLNRLGQVNGVAPGRLLYLFSTAEAVRHDQRIGVGCADGRQQHALTDGLRHRELAGLEAERSGHAAAAGIERLQLDAHLPQQRFLVAHLHDGFLMTMSVEHDCSGEAWRLKRYVP